MADSCHLQDSTGIIVAMYDQLRGNWDLQYTLVEAVIFKYFSFVTGK